MGRHVVYFPASADLDRVDLGKPRFEIAQAAVDRFVASVDLDQPDGYHSVYDHKIQFPAGSEEENLMRKNLTRVWLSAWLIAGFAFAQTGPAGWKGRIVVENGIKTVKNPDQPLYGEFAFELEEDLAIGGDPEKENYYFPKGTSGLAVDDDGNLFRFRLDECPSANVR